MMMSQPPARSVQVFSTCPPSSAVSREAYVERVTDVARWSEQHGCKGILVYTDNSLVDPWLITHIIIQHTKALCPLVAVQPTYMHPYTVAKMIASLGYLYGRRVYLNMVAGGFKNDLAALNDTTPHDKRYERLREYTDIIQQLLTDASPLTCSGEFYKVDRLKLIPSLPRDLVPGVFVSGSSEAGLAAVKALGAVSVEYPKPAAEYGGDPPGADIERGMRIGIIAREDEAEAWSVARARFPEDRKGQLTHQLAMKVSDSVWHKQLTQLGEQSESNPYWLIPFQHYKTFCPYLVGSYRCVGEELARYVKLGYGTFILDVPSDESELRHINIAFRLALQTPGALPNRLEVPPR
ncbi:MAG TPA: LLM class flavin-dependent oxidoreductase [Nitrospiraceae bacterium]|nr:LLM class flavin-dependent oxidoreductase [Nitrospiraceae bacterium]